MTWDQEQEPVNPRYQKVAMCVLRVEGRGDTDVRITLRATPDLTNSALETTQSFADAEAALSAVADFLRAATWK
jgi:hypothetical protein